MSGRVIKVVIASPSDAAVERKCLLDKLQTYFTRFQYEDLCHARIVVNGWETIPSQSGYAQDVINSRLIKEADILLVLFRHTLGTPTINVNTGDDRSPSGTVEELYYAIRQNKKEEKPLAMVFYYKNPPNLSIFSFDAKKQWKKLEEFKTEIRNQILYEFYDDDEFKLLRKVCDSVCANIQNHIVLKV